MSECSAKDDDCEVQPEAEDDCEVQPEELPPLPTTNVENYPQENNDYFQTKRYVRKDKYKLSRIVDAVDLPSILSGHGKKS